jgi:quinol monooxygenase YgiN
VITAFEAAIKRVHDEPGVELYALHEGPDRLVMIEKYTWEQAPSEHREGAALADLRSALDGKLSTDLDAQVSVVSHRRSATTATHSRNKDLARTIPHRMPRSAREQSSRDRCT